MKKIKKWLVLLTAACLAFTCAAFAACGDDEEASNWNSTSSETPGTYSCVITAKNDSGAPLANIQFSLEQNDRVLQNVTTDNNGVATITARGGEYTVNYVSGLPEYHELDYYSQSIELNQEIALTFVATDNTPDGTEGKPYYLMLDAETGEMELTLPANTLWHFLAYAMNVRGREMIVENNAIEIGWNSTVYTAVEGVVSAPIGVDISDTFGTVPFTVKNTSAEEITVTIKMQSPLGSQDNPIELTLNESTEITLTGAEIFYYKWTATESGTLTVTADSVSNSIALYNKNTYVVTSFTDGALTCEIAVNVGDEVAISITAAGVVADDTVTTYNITASFTASAE